MATKKLLPRTLLVFCLLSIVLAGCTAVPIKPESEGSVFQNSAETVHKAAVDALVVLGFDITKSEPSYVEGYRPRNWGFFSSSGGETCGIWLESLNATRTSVRVNTATTSFGRIGQKNWNGDILSLLNKTLGKSE
jgi:hypothetical protein